MSSEEEDDYMSDTFLTKNVDDVRPGLIKNRIKLRENEIAAKKARFDDDARQKQKAIKHLEVERREEGLSSALSSTNKGFAMLAKMGYKQGDAIGKSTKGIVEPIAIQVKTDRAGLGRAAALKQLEEHKFEIRQKRLREREAKQPTVTTDEFRRRMTQKAAEKQIESDLRKCQRACEKLDVEENIESPAIKWFWPDRSENKEKHEPEHGEEYRENEEGRTNIVSESEDQDEIEEEEEEEEDFQSAEKLEMIIDYLRTTYCYCHWCGTKYNDSEDMTHNCPGPTKDDH